MWRRVYLLLVILRLYFALCPSYIHPDEHFQGPEVIAGRVFGYPVNLTWEFTSDRPIRSVFPLWLLYGWPLTIFKWLWEGFGYDHVPPVAIFYALRAGMFTLSFVLEDWALHELLPVPKENRLASLLVASSYVTWTYQNHTFSNSIETLVVLWCLVLVGRVKEDKHTSQTLASAVLAFLAVLGTFNRITFPAFLLIPLAQLLPHFVKKPFSLVVMVISGTATLLLAVGMDTEWYTGHLLHLRRIPSTAIVTPWNNLIYNLDSTNLAKHGLHPLYQHILANLPQLLGPAVPLIFWRPRFGMPFFAAVSGVLTLSCFKHQEARFLLPAVPLVLSSIRLPQRGAKVWIAVWTIFNLCLGFLMGAFHQGGVVPAQLWVGTQDGITQVLWWKTYSPPTYLLGHRGAGVVTRDLMGMAGERMVEELARSVECGANSTLLVAPLSAEYLDRYLAGGGEGSDRPISLEEVWRHSTHLNLDDMDFGDDGVIPTLQRVVGRRGIAAWRVHKQCEEDRQVDEVKSDFHVEASV